MKTILATLAFLVSVATCAAEVTNKVTRVDTNKVTAARKRYHRPRTPEEAAERAKQYQIKKQGGLLYDRRKQAGSVVFVNRQSVIPSATIQEAIKYFDSFSHIELKLIEDKAKFEPVELLNQEKRAGATGQIMIVDAKELKSTMIVSPETHWALVNVAALSADKPSDSLLLSRVVKEINRAFGLTFGAADSRTQYCAMKAVKDLKSLDAVVSEQLSPETYGSINFHLETIGIGHYAIATYATACQEGWAPAPTNDIQKAIWEKVHAPPSKPMKITFDKEKQKPVVK